MFDCEHYFDGYKANPDYALACARAAFDGGADWIILCDTNGGTLPDEIFDIVSATKEALPEANLGIHCHNDADMAEANSLAAVRAGVRQIQGTINGLGERCGNANLISLIPTLMVKLGWQTGIDPEKLPRLTALSRMLDERLNRAPDAHAPYVGAAAFAHKGVCTPLLHRKTRALMNISRRKWWAMNAITSSLTRLAALTSWPALLRWGSISMLGSPH